MNPDYVDYLIHNASIEELLIFYKIKYVFGRTVADYIARRNGFKRKFSSFRQLVEYVDRLKKFPVFHGRVAFSREEKIPFSIDEIVPLLRANGLRGLVTFPVQKSGPNLRPV
jgi:hypothetical protein